ncbi:MAG: hypothetical protein ACRDZ8_17990 [Acidimicrobiales bacterium]
MFGAALRSSRILRAAALATSMGVSLGIAALAVANPVGTASAQANPSVPQGGTATFSATLPINKDCPANATVMLTSSPGPGGANLFPNGTGPTVTRDTTGMFSVTYAVPLSTPVGAYPINVTCAGKSGAVETLNVTAAVTAKPSLSVTPATAAAGATVTFSGQVPTSGGVVSCPAGDATQLTGSAALFPPAGAGPVVNRGGNGSFTQPYQIPANTPAATFTIELRCGASGLVVSTSLQVTRTAATTTSSSTSTTSTTIAKNTTTSLVPSTLLPPGGQTTTTLVFPTVPPVSSTPASKKSGLSVGALGLIGLACVVVALLIAVVVYSRP